MDNTTPKTPKKPQALPPVSGQNLAQPWLTGDAFSLSTLKPPELAALRLKIDALLPNKSLKDFNLESELALQLIIAQTLQNTTLEDFDASASQKAATVAQVAKALSQLASLQNEVYTSERLKRVERTLIETLNTLPPEAQQDFFKNYEAAVRSE